LWNAIASKLPNWREGELIIRLLPKSNDRLQLILGHFINKSLISATDKIQARLFDATKLEKDQSQTRRSLQASLP
tara:strand:- start:334 stop:558 length:225 start_codon:yes stop_codon:yes gene_type:complete